MPFEGDLRLVSLESVLRNIDANNLTGVLTVKDAAGERQLAFQGGRIVAFLPLRGEERSVPDALAKKGLVSKDEVEQVRASLAWKRMNLRRALEYRGLVKETDYVQAVRDEVIVPHLVELFGNRERTFRFEETTGDSTPAELRARWDEDQLAAELRVPIDSVVLECVKRLDEKAVDAPVRPPVTAVEKPPVTAVEKPPVTALEKPPVTALEKPPVTALEKPPVTALEKAPEAPEKPQENRA